MGHFAGRFFLFVCLLLLLPAPLRAQEWTRFRGPNGSGISAATTVPVTFTESDCNWRVELPGEGHSSPVLWGNRIFLTSAEEATGKWHLLCLHAADGRELWRRTYAFKPYPKNRLNGFASSTPVVDAQAVYASMITPESFTVLAFDHSGKELWKRNLGTYTAGNGNGASPIVVGDVVIIANDQEGDDRNQSGQPESALIGLDRKTGAVKWKHKRAKPGPASYATPMVCEPPDGPQEVIFLSTAHGITSLNPLTGELNWELSDLSKLRCVASPIMANGLLIMVTGVGASGDRKGFAVHTGSKSKNVPPKVAYEIPRGSFSQVPTPIAVGDLIFFWGDGGIVNCLRASTGEPLWKERVGGNFYGSPVCVNGKLYAMNNAGELAVIEASDKFKLLAKIPLGEGSPATPAVANGVMYLRTLSHLISVGGKKSQR